MHLPPLLLLVSLVTSQDLLQAYREERVPQDLTQFEAGKLALQVFSENKEEVYLDVAAYYLYGAGQEAPEKDKQIEIFQQAVSLFEEQCRVSKLDLCKKRLVELRVGLGTRLEGDARRQNLDRIKAIQALGNQQTRQDGAMLKAKSLLRDLGSVTTLAAYIEAGKQLEALFRDVDPAFHHSLREQYIAIGKEKRFEK